MLNFNTTGLLIPSSPIHSTLNEFKEYFVVDSPEDARNILFDPYIKYKDDLKSVCEKAELIQWIDGSFVTKKPKPFDIDLVTFLDFEIVKAKEKELKEFIYPASWSNYGIDGYMIVVYPIGHNLHFMYQADRSYWVNQFDKTKPTRRHKRMPKGFLEIII